MFVYKTRGTCSSQIAIQIDDGIVTSVRFTNGCSGNAAGLSRLVQGMPVDEVIRRLQGIQCQNGTSCPDQLAKALAGYQQQAG